MDHTINQKPICKLIIEQNVISSEVDEIQYDFPDIKEMSKRECDLLVSYLDKYNSRFQAIHLHLKQSLVENYDFKFTKTFNKTMNTIKQTYRLV